MNNDKLKPAAVVRSSNAPEEIEINAEGIVLTKDFAAIWGHQIIKFDLEEYQTHYNESDIDSDYDILDLASYEVIDGEVKYFPACAEFREHVREHQERERQRKEWAK
tara:strand:+ start:880 stop:1200 length:321 start_codon:yes stop_codon:yes gene_type:complete